MWLLQAYQKESSSGFKTTSGTKESDQKIILPELNSTSYFPFPKIYFLYTAIISTVLLITLILGGSNYIFSSTNYANDMRLITFVIGPILTFITLFSVLNFLFIEESYRPTFRIILEFSIIGGLISILMALTLNTRAFLIEIAVALTVNQDVGAFIGPAIFAPLIEELAKCLPIYFLSRGLMTRPNEDKEYRVFQNIKTPVYVGAITGMMFNCLETFWYIWNTGYLFDVSNNEAWRSILLQIVLRSTNLLHIFNACVIGVGIGFSLYHSPNKVLRGREYSYAIYGYLMAFGMHALWNGSLVLQTDSTPSIDIFGESLPIVNVILVLITFFGLFSLWIYLRNYSAGLCTYCGEWHVPPYDEEIHYQFTGITPGLYSRIKNSLFRKRTLYTCPTCRNVIGSSRCSNCQNSTSFNCSHCSSPIPAHATACWNCGLKCEPPFVDITLFPETDSSIIVKPVIYILAGFYLPASIAILIIISRSISDTSNQIIKVNDQIMVIYLFLFLIGLAFLRIVRWLNNPFSYSMGHSLARTIFSMLIFQFAMLFIALGIIFVAISGLLLSGLLFLLESIIILHYGISILFGFSPLFHQVEDERLIS